MSLSVNRSRASQTRPTPTLPRAESLRSVFENASIPERIFLVGFMGCGKSTVGRLLGDHIGWRFVDLDVRIEQWEGRTIPAMFAQSGERYFRRIENEVLLQVSREPQRVVVALGGGTFVSEVNRALVERCGVSLWLDVPFKVMLARLSRDGRRPLARSAEQLTALYSARVPFYHEADLRLRTAQSAPLRVAQAALRLLRNDWAVVAERRRLSL